MVIGQYGGGWRGQQEEETGLSVSWPLAQWLNGSARHVLGHLIRQSRHAECDVMYQQIWLASHLPYTSSTTSAHSQSCSIAMVCTLQTRMVQQQTERSVLICLVIASCVFNLLPRALINTN